MCLCSLRVFVINPICSGSNIPHIPDLPMHGRLLKAHTHTQRESKSNHFLAQFTVFKLVIIRSIQESLRINFLKNCIVGQYTAAARCFSTPLPYVLMDGCICQCGTLLYATHTVDSGPYSSFTMSSLKAFIADCRMT